MEKEILPNLQEETQETQGNLKGEQTPLSQESLVPPVTSPDSDNPVTDTSESSSDVEEEVAKEEEAAKKEAVAKEAITKRNMELQQLNEQIETVQLKYAALEDQYTTLKKEYSDLLSKKTEDIATFRKEAETTLEAKKQQNQQISEEWEHHQQRISASWSEYHEKLTATQLEDQASWDGQRKKQEDKQQELRLQAMAKQEKDVTAYKEELFAKAEKEYQEQQSRRDQEKQEIQEEKQRLTQWNNELETKEETLDAMKTSLDGKKQVLSKKEEDLEEDLEERMEEEREKFTRTYESLKKEHEILSERYSTLESRNNDLERKFDSYGSDPSILEKKISDLQRHNQELNNELARRPQEFNVLDLEKAKQEARELREEKAKWSDSQSKYQELQRINEGIQISNSGLEEMNRHLEYKNEELRAYINRHVIEEHQAPEYEKRLEALRIGVDAPTRGLESYAPEEKELYWLERILTSCNDSGFYFPKRIVYAFHAALKIADWSMITVLAGVSGTGKSELPSKYAQFGGLEFFSAAVQPNWDSQESMLGFYNSMDNRFDPQPLLRFLVQKVEDPALKDTMALVLLDEMNLAHVEHYFAEFLSKLEMRRDKKTKDVPSIEVKLGTGVAAYQLPLDRTILWTGTMNQDETTKSLSDKVLDRGIVINFPRPTTFKRRKKQGVRGQNGNKVNRELWGAWCQKKLNWTPEEDKHITEYKTLIEEINQELGKQNRALGHRVWQSMEYYVMNYPLVILERSDSKMSGEEQVTSRLKEAINIAMEDQIVQKIMPKLRGIEVRRQGGEVLHAILSILMGKFSSLEADYKNAMEMGYGQFMWCTSLYVETDRFQLWENLFQEPLVVEIEEEQS